MDRKISKGAFRGGKDVPTRREKSVHEAELKKAILPGAVGAIGWPCHSPASVAEDLFP